MLAEKLPAVPALCVINTAEAAPVSPKHPPQLLYCSVGDAMLLGVQGCQVAAQQLSWAYSFLSESSGLHLMRFTTSAVN